MAELPSRPTLFPYTTLFRSARTHDDDDGRARMHARRRRQAGAHASMHDDDDGQARTHARTMTTTDGHACIDRKSTRLNSSHTVISYAVFCLKKKKKNTEHVK